MRDSAFRQIVLAACIIGLSAACGDTAEPDAAVRSPAADYPYVEILDERALTLLDADAQINVLADGYLWTEGPVWVEDEGFLLFSDIPNNVIMRFDPLSGTSVFLENAGATGLIEGDYGAGPNGLLLDHQGRLVVFQQGDRRISYLDAPLSVPRARFVTLVSRFDGKRLNSPNDGVFHSDGSLYFTDPPYGLPDRHDDARKQLPFQGIYRLDAEGLLTLLDDSVDNPNGIGLSRDEKTMYVAVSDAERPVWLAYDLLPDGSTANRRTFYDASHLRGDDDEPGLPDGMAVHSTGAIFATGPGGVWLFSAGGDVLGKIRTGKRTANCTLAADESVLYITAHDTLMSVPLKLRQERPK